jgi:hypothetical protein
MGPVSSKEFEQLLAKVGAQMAQDNPQLRYRVRYLEAQTDAQHKEVLREYIREFPDAGQRQPWFQERIEEHGLQYYVPGEAAETQPWYESDPKVLRRRQIVLRNPHWSARQYCNLFDSPSDVGNNVPLPTDWEEKYGVTSWKEAYKNPETRPLIQKMVASDKKKG